MTSQEPRTKARPLFRLRLNFLLHRIIIGKIKVAVHSRSEWELYLGWQEYALVAPFLHLSACLKYFIIFNENIINGHLCESFICMYYT